MYNDHKISPEDEEILTSLENGEITLESLSEEVTDRLICRYALPTQFPTSLEDIDLSEFKYILKDFHKLPTRIRQFNEVCKNINTETKRKYSNLINTINILSKRFKIIYSSSLKLRLCHNDSKLNNILFSKSKKGLYLIDIDTIMPGLILYDFGDTVRTLVNPTSEEETDLSKIKFNKEMFDSFISGFKTALLNIEENERNLLPLSVALMPFMHGLRALIDYLNGNIYYKVNYENQNLDRSQSLFEFTRKALLNQEAITKIINEQFTNRAL